MAYVRAQSNLERKAHVAFSEKQFFSFRGEGLLGLVGAH